MKKKCHDQALFSYMVILLSPSLFTDCPWFLPPKLGFVMNWNTILLSSLDKEELISADYDKLCTTE